jgi:phosphoribosylformylglycinamidine synthase I
MFFIVKYNLSAIRRLAGDSPSLPALARDGRRAATPPACTASATGPALRLHLPGPHHHKGSRRPSSAGATPPCDRRALISELPAGYVIASAPQAPAPQAEVRIMKSAIVVFPGSNRERDVSMALERSTGRVPDIVWHRDTELPETDLIVIPGGFAYGDYLRCGAMAAHSPIMREIAARAARGTPVLGICNGFQVLTEAGLLPGVLLSNQTLKFHCKDVHLRVETSQTLFTSGYEQGQVIRVPVAHHDGNYFADPATLDRLEDKGLVAFRYCSPAGELTDEDNHNGSARNIAGIFNETKTVLGLMPHPEDATDELLGGTDGRGLFDGIAGALGS